MAPAGGRPRAHRSPAAAGELLFEPDGPAVWLEPPVPRAAASRLTTRMPRAGRPRRAGPGRKSLAREGDPWFVGLLPLALSGADRDGARPRGPRSAAPRPRY